MGDEGSPQGRFGLPRRLAGRAGYSADRILDETQANVFRLLWFFLPEPSIARNLRFQHILASRFLSDAGQQAIVFGALVEVARRGGSALEGASIGVAALVPPALLGLYGGEIADRIPKRTALAGAYTLQAFLCFLLPAVLGTDLPVVLGLIFAVNGLGQISGPTESSVLPLVATEEELASGASLVNLSASAGTAFGTALLAPVLVRAVGVDAVFYVSGVMLLAAASRVFDLPVGEAHRRLQLPPMRTRFRAALRWLARHPAVATMIFLSVLAGTVNIVLQTLAPRYVEAVLEADAADTAYVFAPSAVGIVIGLVSAPSVMRFGGERIAAIFGLLVAAASLFLLGTVGDVGSIIDQVNPMHFTEVLGISLNEKLRTAGLLALPLAFGVSLTATSVQTYINRRVPLSYQGRTFAIQGTLRNGAAIIPLLTMGALASEFGAEKVLLVSPLLLVAIGYGLVRLSYRFAGVAPPPQQGVMASYWEEPEARLEVNS